MKETARQAPQQPSRRTLPVSTVVVLALLFAFLLFLSLVSAQSAHINVPVPNGNLNIIATDLSQQSATGAMTSIFS